MEALLSKAREVKTVEEAEALLFLHCDISSDILQKALELSKVAHQNQTRKSGEPYIIHPILVASFTALISNDEMMIAAALMHDVVEDTDYSIEDLIEILVKILHFW